MGNIPSSRYIQCFNHLNARIYKQTSNYGLPLYECVSIANDLDAISTWRYGSGGCASYVCDECYDKYYHSDGAEGDDTVDENDEGWGEGGVVNVVPIPSSLAPKVGDGDESKCKWSYYGGGYTFHDSLVKTRG